MGEIRIFTVRGVTDNVTQLALHFGLLPQTVHARLNIGWGIEQSLGLVAPPPRRAQGGRGCHLPAGPRLVPIRENLLAAMFTPLPGEEFLRREGIPLNGHPLTNRLPDDEET